MRALCAAAAVASLAGYTDCTLSAHREEGMMCSGGGCVNSTHVLKQLRFLQEQQLASMFSSKLLLMVTFVKDNTVVETKTSRLKVFHFT